MREAAPASTSGLANRLLAIAVTLLGQSLIVGSLPHPWFHVQQIMAAPIVFAATFLFFGRRKLQSAEWPRSPIRRPILLLHALTLAALIATTEILLRRMPPGTPVADAPVATFSATFWFIALWYIAILTLIATIASALLPLRRLATTLASMRAAWLYAALITLATMASRNLVRWIWDAPNSSFGRALQEGTFYGTRKLLQLAYPQVIAIPATHILGTPTFLIEVAGTCSGIEGLALILVFTLGWLIFARRELYLARAMLLVPAALTLSWLLNLVRIALLIAIGNAGHPQTAINGFHSEAGWILFNAVAIGFLLSVQRLRWLQRDPEARPTIIASSSDQNVVAAYLLPFLLVLATSLLSHAASSGFDWLYPLRPLVAAATLWAFRKHYAHLDWRFGWLGPIAGVAVFLLWLASARLQHNANPSALPSALAQLAPWQRSGWLTARILSAVITVPIAEELAFRGYLARRFMNADIETVAFRQISFVAIAGSSLAFGLLHGSFWLVGVIAGVIFALVARLTNRIGDAMAAHATANMLLALCVLWHGDYWLW